ncbi:MAG: hypothetical protein E7262_01530 [Lachnospiraceae bacterium]|nr:hypothetical protein [Lachnospiraceae bacterium]
MTKFFKSLKYASVMLVALVLTMFICTTDTQAASYPIGSVKYPIGTYTEGDFTTNTSNIYGFKYQEYSQKGTNNYRVLSLQSQLHKSGADAQTLVRNYDSTAKVAGAGQSWYVYKIRLNYHTESTITDAISPSTIISSYNFTNAAGSSITMYDYDNFSLNYDYAGYKTGLSGLKITPGYYVDFYYAILIDTSVGQPLFYFYNYAGALDSNKCFASLNPARINKMDICNGKATVGTATYTGKARATTYTVYDQNGKKLTKGTDYTVSYYNNIKPGVATVKFTGIGKYEGVMEKYFYIKPVQTSISIAAVDTTTAKLSWKAVPNAYVYNIYKYNTKTKKYVYLKQTYSTSVYVDGMASAYTYKYAVYPYAIAKDPYTGYSILNSSNKTTYIKGSPKTKSVTTRPNRATLKKITRPARKTLSVWWNKSTRASGYKVCVSTGYGMKGVLKTYYTTATAKKITGLPSGKWVYVNVIPYKTVGKTKLYSPNYYYYYSKVS